MNEFIGYAVIAPAGAGAPLVLMGVLAAVAWRRKPQALADKAVRRWTAVLAGATIAVWLGFAAWVVADRSSFASDEPSVAVRIAGVAAFAALFGLSFPAMGALERATAGPSVPDQPQRSASLGVRTVGAYLSTSALAAPYLTVAAAAAVVGWRALDQPLRGSQYYALFFLAVAAIFLFLYAVALAEATRAPQALTGPGGGAQPGDPVADRAADSVDRIRRDNLVALHRWQVVLTAGLAIASVAVAFLDGNTRAQAVAATVIIALAALLATAGCARAIGTNLTKGPLRPTL
jgi:hypothetical protein